MTSLGPTPKPQQSLEEKLAEFDNVPLFMKSLPSEDSEDSKLAALQSLAYEGTPDEIALNFKEQGNDYFKGRRYREALGFYTQGIDAKPEDPSLKEVLMINRAACNLELKNYGSVLRDCSSALLLNPKSSKAYYRSALALNGLERYEEGLDCCDRCLAFDAENKIIQDLRAKLLRAKEAKEKKEREKAERERKEKEEKRILNQAFKERNIIPTANPTGTTSSPYQPHFDPEDSTNSTMVFPVFFLYPQHATSDVIPSFIETTPFSAHLEQMFPPSAPAPDWDVKGEYRTDRLVVYAITKRKRLLKVGKKMSLADVCKAAKPKEGEEKDGLELKEGCLSFVVVVKGEQEEKWVNEFKSTR